MIWPAGAILFPLTRRARGGIDGCSHSGTGPGGRPLRCPGRSTVERVSNGVITFSALREEAPYQDASPSLKSLLRGSAEGALSRRSVKSVQAVGLPRVRTVRGPSPRFVAGSFLVQDPSQRARNTRVRIESFPAGDTLNRRKVEHPDIETCYRGRRSSPRCAIIHLGWGVGSRKKQRSGPRRPLLLAFRGFDMWQHQEMYDVHQVARQLLLTEHTVYQYLREGSLKGLRVGRSWRIPELELRNYLRGDRGQNPRIAAHQIKLVHFVDAKPESVCLAFEDGSQVKLTMYDARRILQSSEIARGGGLDLDGHHLNNQDALTLMTCLVSYFVRVAPGGASRMFATRARLKDPQDSMKP